MNQLLPNQHPDGADDAALVARSLQNGADHIGGGGLPLGAGHADHRDIPLGRVAEEGGAHQGQGLPGVLHQDHLGAGGLHRLLSDHRHSPCLGSALGVLVAVGVGAPQAHKRTPRHCLPGVVYDIGYFYVLIPLCNGKGGQQTAQLHKKHFLSQGNSPGLPC